MPHEMLKIYAFIDNTKCNKDLDAITTKLVRRIEARHECWTYRSDEILDTRTYPGVRAYDAKELNLTFSLQEISSIQAKTVKTFRKKKNKDVVAEDIAM